VEQREPMKKLSIDKKKQKEVRERTAMVDAMMEQIDHEVDLAVIDLLKELGYEAKEGMSLEEAQKLEAEMSKAGQYISIVPRQEEDTYIVDLQVIQLARTLKFDLGGE
jgi:hypothetical protein